MAADNTVNVGINVSDNGTTQKVTKNVKVLKDVLDQAVVSAAKLAMGGGTPAPRMAGGGSVPPSGGGAAAIASGGAARPPGGAASAQAEYGAMRGVAGSTGASARDFAKEAEGLNGLVRVYASFAAMIYVVTAAFGVLSKAMDTSNMVQGLNQLGAASGVSLGNLSKRLVDATDGAVSLRQAMQSVAQASAAGISSTNILRMGDVAKKTSQALGIDMADALSRISRGVTKLEPELLDELGIFTKLDESNRKYAITLGKSAGSLTDFEKRQGFANAVLDEATKKFGDLKIDANPYSKLSATFQDLAQTGLELINKVLTPIVGLLASSPMALAGVLGYIGINVLAKTIPAIGKWQESLKNAAEQAKNTSESIAKNFDDKFQTNLESRFKLPGLKQSLVDSEKELAKISSATFVGPMAAAPRNLGPSASAAGMDPKGLSTINDLLATRNTRLETGYAGAAKMSATQIQATKDEVKWLEAKAKAIEHEIALTTAAAKVSKNKADIDTAQTKIGSIADKNIGALDPQNVKLKLAEKARTNYDKLSAVHAASEMADINGVRAAWDQLGNTIKEKGITGIDKFSTLAQGGLAAVGTRLIGLVSAFSVVGTIAGVIAVTYGIIDTLASKNTKEAEATVKSLALVSDAIKNVSNVLEAISKKDSLGQISSQSIGAKTTALGELSTGLKTVLEDMDKEVKAANWWDTFKNNVSTLWSGNVELKTAKNIAAGLQKAFDLAPLGPITEKARKTLAMVNIDPDNIADSVGKIEKSIDYLGPLTARVVADMSKEMNAVKAKADELDQAFDAASKTYDQILISTLPTDNISKLGQESIRVANAMAEAFKDPETQLSKIAVISSDITKLRMFGPETSKALLDMAPKLQKDTAELAGLNIKLKEHTRLLEAAKAAETNQQMGGATSGGGEFGIGGAVPATDEVKKQESLIAVITGQIDKFGSRFAGATALLNKGMSESLVNGAVMIERSIMNGFAKAAITVESAYAAILGDSSSESIKLQADLQKKSNDIQINQTRVTLSLIDSNESLRIAHENQTDELRKLSISAMGPEVSKEKKKQLMDQIDLEIAERKKLYEDLKGAKTTTAKLDILKKSGAAGVFAGNLQGPEIPETGAANARAKAAAGAMAGVTQRAAGEGQIAELKASNKAIDIGALRKEKDLELKLALELKAAEVDRLNTEKTLFDLRTQGLAYLNAEQLATKNKLESNILDTQQAQERMQLQNKIDILKISEQSTDKVTREAAAASIENLKKEQGFLTTKQANAVTILAEKERIQNLNNIKAIATAKLDVIKSNFDTEVAKETTLFTIKEENLNKLSSLGALSPAALVAAQTQMATDKEVARNKQALFDIEDKHNRDLAEYNKQVGISGETESIKNAKVASDAAYTGALANEAALSAARRINIKLTGDNTEALARQKEVMDNLVSSTESLAAVFGKVGEGIGGALQGIQKIADTEVNYLTQRNALEIERNNVIKSIPPEATAEERLALTKTVDKNLTDLDKKNAQNQISNNISVLNSTKKMFGEKTAAYKAIDAIEKVQHLRRIYENNKELINTIWAEGKKLFAKVFTAESGTAALAESTVAAATFYELDAAAAVTTATPGIFAKFSEQMGVWGWAAAAAVVAALGFSGGGPSKPPMGFTAEEQQKVQGTGQVYRNGKLVDTGAGALGDATQKSESVANGIANIEKYSFDGLDYSNKMLDALKAIRDNTANLSTAILKTIPGLNIKPADVTGGNWLFGKSSSSVVDAGVILAGSFGQLIDKTGELSSYINTVTTSSGFLGFGSDTTANSEVKTINNESDLARVVSSIIGSVGDALSEAGSTLGLGMSNDILKSFRELKLPEDIRASILGLKPSEQSDAILQVISAGLDSAARDLFSSLEEYQKAGETFGDTVLRLANDSMVVNKNFQMLGVSLTKLDETTSKATDAMYADRNRAQEKLRQVIAASNTWVDTSTDAEYRTSAPGATFEQVAAAQKLYDDAVNRVNLANAGTTTNNIALYEAIIKASGGLDKFTENTKAFSEAFLTDREKITPRVDALHNALVDLSYGTITTRDEFKQLILGFKITNETSAETYAKLIALSAGFDAVAQFEEKLADSRDSQTDTIRKLIGTEKTLAASLKASRDRELKAMDPSLVATQKYINALTDEVAARDKAATAVKSTIDSLKGSVKTLTDYQTSLATSAQGNMTPEQRYAALQQELLSTQTAAMGPTDTPAQLAAQQAAATKLPQAASAFLDASKVLNASSSKYSDDLAGVQKIIADTITSVTGTQTLAEKNLTALGPLVSIDASTKSTAELMQAFVTAQGVTETARLAMDIATNQWQTNLLAALNPIELVGPVQPTEAVRLASDAAASIKLTTASDTLATTLTATDTLAANTGVLNTSTTNLTASIDTLTANVIAIPSVTSIIADPAFATFLAKTIGDAIDTGAIVTAIQDAAGAQIVANATVVANQTAELTAAQLDAIAYQDYLDRSAIQGGG